MAHLQRLCVLGLLCLSGTVCHAADEATIANAIKRGAEYLQKMHSGNGGYTEGSHGFGHNALVGIALLEAGVAETDPALKNITQFVRDGCLKQPNTYHISLAVLFLDRLGDPRDVPVIQMLGVRLLAGLNAMGGWSYVCWQDTSGAEQLLQTLRSATLTTDDNAPDTPKKNDDGFLKPSDGKPFGTTKLHSEVQKMYDLVQKSIKASGRSGAPVDDNSNTQFGLVALWVAARNGVPAHDAFALVEARFIRTQSPTDAGWAYTSGFGAGNGGSSAAMTCAGLLGLALGKGSREKKRELKGGKTNEGTMEIPEGRENDPFYNPTNAEGKPADDALKGENKAPPNVGRSASAALKTLGAYLASLDRMGDKMTIAPGLGNAYYTLWSIERVAMAYNLETIGGIDWHQLGANYLLRNQAADGSFMDSQYATDINTAFAILFLSKSNFTRDLSSKKGIDPGKAELRGGAAAKEPVFKDPPPGQKPSGNGAPEPEQPKGTGFSLPEVAEPTADGEAEKIARELVNATDAFADKLTEARNSKGSKWTKALVLSAARLDGDRRYQAREALAERLTRMTAKTLRAMMKDPEVELRRAATLACAMKDAPEHIPDLIERINDPSEFVVRAARAALRSFAPPGTDHGPTNPSDDDAKAAAALAWQAWYDSRNEKK